MIHRLDVHGECIVNTLLLAGTLGLGLAAVDRSINLADFGRVVQFTGDDARTLEVKQLDRGEDGWQAWQGEGGQWMIGLEWDEPRDVAQVEIEFRHAIADRDQIAVQYFKNHWPHSYQGGWAPLDDPFHGKWLTAKAEWWAGDRDVGFAFAPYNEEQPGDEAPKMEFRRTYRLRFLLGKRDEALPAVRYLRVYGPTPPTEAAFELRFDPRARLKPPLDMAVLNGYLLNADDRTTTRSASLDESSKRLRVRFVTQDVDSPNRTIVTLRDQRDARIGMSFLPAEVVERGLIRVPAWGVAIAHVGSQKDFGADPRPGMSVFDRVATEAEQTFERARREIPSLRKTAQTPVPFYMPLAPPDTRQEVAVSYDGSVYLERSALKVPADDSERLHWPADRWRVRLGSGEPAFDHLAEGAVRQRRLEGYLPIVINEWEQGGVRYEQTCVGTFLAGDPAPLRGDETVVLLSRLVATASGAGPATATVRLWPEPGEPLSLEAGHVRALGATTEEGVKPYEQPRHRFHVQAARGELTLKPIADGLGQEVAWRCDVRPGEPAILEWRVPFVTLAESEELRQLAGLNFDQVMEHEAERWRRLIASAATIEVPEPLLNDFYKAQLANILITADRDPYTGWAVLPAGTYQYGVCVNESCHQIRSLEIRGLHGLAERYLAAILDGQSSRALQGRFTSVEGVFHGLPTRHGDYQQFNYNLDHGFALWMLNEHYRFTRDRRWLMQVADKLIAACDFITRERHTETEANTLGRGDRLWGEGLLPPGHLEDPPEWLWWFAVNAYAARGMRMTAESLAEIEDPDAARIAVDAAEFDRCLRASCREAMLRSPVVALRDGVHVPHQPTRSRSRHRDLGWIRDALYGAVHLIDCGIYEPDSPEAEWILRDTEDNVFISADRGRKLTDFDKQWFSWGGITLQSNLLPNPLIYLRRNQPKHALRAFWNSLAANVYEDVRVFAEHPIEAYGIGLGPFYKSPDESAFIVWLRHLLVMESGDELDLLAGVPAGWLAKGQVVTVRGAATWFGPMDIETRSEPDPRRVLVRLAAPERNPPKCIRLHIRVPAPIGAVTVNGQRLSTFDPGSGIITLPGNVGRADVVISY